MKKFFLKCLAAVSVPILCLLPFVIAGFLSGELKDIDRLRADQLKSPQECKLGLAYSDPAPYYKYANIIEQKPEFISLGTSVVLQVKDYFFPDANFYNAGRGVENINEYEDYLKAVAENGVLPDTVLISLDADFFNENWNGDLSARTLDLEKPKRPWSTALKSIIPDFFHKKWSFSALTAESGDTLLGMNALMKNSGFLKDGSYYWGYIYEYPQLQEDYQFKNTFWRIENGVLRFEYAQSVDPRALSCLDSLLAWCAGNGVQVVGFTPPFAPPVLDKMRSMGDKYGYLEGIAPACRELFSRYGFEYYDFMDLRDIGLDESYFVDGFHAGEPAAVQMLKTMLEAGSVLNRYADPKHLEDIFDSRAANLYVAELPRRRHADSAQFSCDGANAWESGR